MTPSHVAAAHSEVGVLAFLLRHHAKREQGGRRQLDSSGPRYLSSVQPTPCILAWNNDFHFKVCSLLLEAQAEVGMNCHAHPFAKSISQGASVEIQNLLSLHSQFQCLERKCHIHELSLSLICGFQFVTAVFVVSAKSRMCAAGNVQLSRDGNAPQPVGTLSMREKGARVEVTITSRSLCHKMYPRQRKFQCSFRDHLKTLQNGNATSGHKLCPRQE